MPGATPASAAGGRKPGLGPGWAASRLRAEVVRTSVLCCCCLGTALADAETPCDRGDTLRLRIGAPVAQRPRRVLGAVLHEVLGDLGSRQLTDISGVCALSLMVPGSSLGTRPHALIPGARHRAKRRKNFTFLSVLRNILKAATRPFHLSFVDQNLVSWSCLGAEEAGKCVLAGRVPRALLLGRPVVRDSPLTVCLPEH